jgi:hypothetical protein
MSIVPPTRSNISVLVVCKDDTDLPCAASQYSISFREREPEYPRLRAVEDLCEVVASGMPDNCKHGDHPRRRIRITKVDETLEFHADNLVLLRPSSDGFANSAHHELLRRIGWLVVGRFGSRIEDGLGERDAL